jgi:uncharacterized membrane protein YeaQ/YmgE (transglycosylase-associated protein family)
VAAPWEPGRGAAIGDIEEVFDMGLVWLGLFGLVAGSIAKWIRPDNAPESWWQTMLLGIGGAWVGNWVGGVLGFGPYAGFSFGGIALAVLGALIILWAYGKMKD